MTETSLRSRLPGTRRSLVLAAFLFLGHLLVAPELTLAQSFGEETEVTVVEVPVSVVDKNGDPVRGLTAEDFTILDNGKKQKIRSLDVIDFEMEIPADYEVLGSSETLPAAARRRFFFLFDLSFSQPISVIRAREAARRFVLNNLHPTDLVAVATFSLETGPRLLVTFTPDRAQLARAIDTLGARGLRDRYEGDPLRFLYQVPERSTPESSRASESESRQGIARRAGQDALTEQQRVLARLFDREQDSFAKSRITDWSKAMAALAKSLNSVQGRKQIIFFSEGFDSKILLGRTPDSENLLAQDDQLRVAQGQAYLVDSEATYGSTELQGDINKMLREFRRSDSVIQAVDIGGLRAGADIRGRDNRGQEGLFYIANETGGELFKDANDLGSQLSRVMHRTAVTYLLSFQPDQVERNGEYRKLKIKVNGHKPGRVAHRDGYYAPRPFSELHPLERSLLAADAIASANPRDEIGLDVLAVPFRASESSSYVPVILEAKGVDLLAGHRRELMNVEIYTYVSDANGEMRDFFSQVIGLDLRKAKAKQAMSEGGLKYYGHLNLSPGKYLVRVLVRNADTGRTGVKTVSVTVPSYADQDPQVLPPFFLEDPGRWVLVRESEDRGRESVVYPFTVKGEPYIPAARPVLRPRDKAEVCLVAYNLKEGELEITSRVLDHLGEVVDGGTAALVERTVTGIDGLDKLLVSFNPRGLRTGDYTLELSVAGGAAFDMPANTVAFSVLN